MLYNYFTEKLLGLQGVLIENIEEIDDTIHIYCKLERKIHKCPGLRKSYRQNSRLPRTDYQGYSGFWKVCFHSPQKA